MTIKSGKYQQTILDQWIVQEQGIQTIPRFAGHSIAVIENIRPSDAVKLAIDLARRREKGSG